MLKKTITYTNPFTDAEVTEEHYFHISKADLVEMEMESQNAEYIKDGETLTGMQAKLQRIIDSNDGKAIIIELKDILRRAYGRRDGERFLKSPEIWAEFSSTEAYSQLIFDLCTDAKEASDFINGIIPKNMEQIAEEVAQRARELESASQGVDAAANGQPSEEPKTLTPEEISEMDPDELKSGIATGRYKLSS